MPRLAEELRIRHANGTFTRWLDILKNTDVLVLDDWGLVGMDAQTRTDLLEMIDDRCLTSTILTARRQLSWPVEAGDEFNPLLAWADLSHRCGHGLR